MSVIQEALRKAQRENDVTPGLPPSQRRGSEQRGRVGEGAQKRFRGIALALILVSAGVGGAVLLHDRLISAESPTKSRRLVRALPAAPERETPRVRRDAPQSKTGAPVVRPPVRKPYRPDRKPPELPKSVPPAVAVAGPAEPPEPPLPKPKPKRPVESSTGKTASPPAMEKAQRLLKAGDLQGAESTLHALIREDPEHIEAIVALANVYFREMKAPERAYPLYQRVLSLDPHRSAAHVNLGVYYLRKGDLARAREYTERALELVPDLAEARYNLACIEALGGNRAAAERALQRATAIDPRCAKWAKDDPDLVLLRKQGAAGRSTLP